MLGTERVIVTVPDVIITIIILVVIIVVVGVSECGSERGNGRGRRAQCLGGRKRLWRRRDEGYGGRSNRRRRDRGSDPWGTLAVEQGVNARGFPP